MLSLKIMKNHQKWKKNVKIVKSNFRSLGQEFSKFRDLNFSQGPESAVQEPVRFQGLREPGCFARFLNPELKSFTFNLY